MRKFVHKAFRIGKRVSAIRGLLILFRARLSHTTPRTILHEFEHPKPSTSGFEPLDYPPKLDGMIGSQYENECNAK